MNKAKIISILITIGASLDVIYGFLTDNATLLHELFGLSPKVSQIIMLLGLLWTAFNKSITQKSNIVGDRPPTSGGR